MASNGRKYQIQGELAYPHAGQIIEKYLSEHEPNRSRFARKMGVMPTTIIQYFTSDSLQMGILWKLSLITKHNFLLEIGSKLPIDYPTPGVLNLQQQLEAKQQEIETLKIEMAALQKQVEHLGIEVSVYKNIMGK
jgi:hypothetical protein